MFSACKQAMELDSIFVLEITTVVFVMMVGIVAMESEQSIGPSELVPSGNIGHTS